MTKKDWVIATYCDYGKKNNKKVIRLSYSIVSGNNCWDRFKKAFSKNGYRCWQEDKDGNIINDSNPEPVVVIEKPKKEEPTTQSICDKPKKNNYKKQTKQQHDYSPTIDEIRKECLKFRESWTEKELYKRAGLDEPGKCPYSVPICDLSGPINELSCDNSSLI